jgi:2,2-dialkylglycine decarboxylase (pyruvate)
MNLVRGQSAGSANCLRMAPPLTVSDAEVDLALTVIDAALTTVTNELTVR